MRFLKVQIMLLILAIGCTSKPSSTTTADSGTGTASAEAKSNNPTVSAEAKESRQGGSQPSEVANLEQRMIERFRKKYGGRELRAWPNISIASIGQDPTSKDVREIIKLDAKVKAVLAAIESAD